MKNQIYILIGFILATGLVVALNTRDKPELLTTGAATVETLTNAYKPSDFDYNTDYSFKDFTGRTLKDKNLNGMIIYGSSFSQETPDSHIFPDSMTGVTFIRSNLDNVYIPTGNTVIDSSQRIFKIQNDGEDWILNVDGTPKEPINKEDYIEKGLSVDPKDLPKTPLTEPITTK